MATGATGPDLHLELDSGVQGLEAARHHAAAVDPHPVDVDPDLLFVAPAHRRDVARLLAVHPLAARALLNEDGLHRNQDLRRLESLLRVGDVTRLRQVHLLRLVNETFLAGLTMNRD